MKRIALCFDGTWNKPADDSIDEGIETNVCRFREYQTIALDEHRVDFEVCLWDSDAAPEQPLEQRWFCGAHCDVGGGYPSRKLSDLPLRWMQDKAAGLGLALDKVAVDAENFPGDLTDSYSDFLLGEYARLKQIYYRPVFSTRFGNEQLDASIDQRRSATLAPPYAPPNSGLPPLTA